MAQNLRARLTRIREQRRDGAASIGTAGPAKPAGPAGAAVYAGAGPEAMQRTGWIPAGDLVLRRTLTLPLSMPGVLPDTLPLLLPDLIGGTTPDRAGSGTFRVPRVEQFLFFDLETTGLSGGAGTVAFLAAFGRFVPGPSEEFSGLEITQILLLDYPGEEDFLEAVLGLLKFQDPFFLTTYNGKAFDSQILKTRCLMNGLALPPLLQADLLYPARRLWKRILPNCSQATVETMVLGLDRSGDPPGSMAPGIWFDFLRAGAGLSGGPEAAALQGICDHNVRDIFGLASLFRTFTDIAAAPLDAIRRFYCDGENLALRWRRALRHDPRSGEGLDPAARKELEETAFALLREAAEIYPRCCLRLAFDLRAGGRYKEGRERLLFLRNRRTTEPAGEKPLGRECTVSIKALALRTLAIDAERQLGRGDLALAYVEEALALEPAGTAGETAAANPALPRSLREDLERRRERLIHKPGFWNKLI